MSLKKLIINILIPLVVGGIVAFIMMPFNDYKELVRPALAPPAIAFPIVWTVLYILMGIGAYLISKERKVPLIYYAQLFVNALWSIIFFVFKWRLFAFIWLILLAVLVILMILNFKRTNKLAGFIQIPYLIWVLFAGYLNLGVYLLN